MQLRDDPGQCRPFLTPGAVDWKRIVPRVAAFLRCVYGARTARSPGLSPTAVVPFSAPEFGRIPR
jgi:hypothetical protein